MNGVIRVKSAMQHKGCDGKDDGDGGVTRLETRAAGVA